MRIAHYALALLLLILLLFVAAVPMLAMGCEDRLVSSKISVTKISLIFDGSFDSALKLRIRSARGEYSEYVIDKSEYSTLRLIKYNDRVLVANDIYIFAAYDITTDQIIRYDELPFTIWEGQGELLDSYKWFDDPARMRPDFPLQRENRRKGD